jgi:ADP-heptose:LPS heptosyltransferase
MILRRNILLFHLAALGDFVLTWPLALALARLHPQSRVIYVTHGQKGALAEKALNLESCDIEGGWHHLYGNPEQLPQAARKLLQGAHSVYSFVASGQWAGNVARLAPDARLCCLQARPPADYESHAAEYLLSQLANDAAVAEATRQILHSLNTNGLRRYAGGPAVVIHPGSGSPEKCWPAEKYVELAQRLRNMGKSVRIILGETELERWPADRIAAFGAAGEIRRPASYVELLSELSGAALFVGNDSGPSHLAGVLGIPTWVLFGPTNPAVWHPLGPSVKTLRREPLNWLNVDQVLAWLLPAGN